MIRLTAVELRRLLARRVTWLALLGGIVLAGLILVGVRDQVQYLTPEHQAQLRTDFKAMHDQWVRNHVADEQACIAQLPADQRDLPETREMCAMPEPRLEDFLGGTGSLTGLYENAVTVLMPMMWFVVFLLGASFVAAEFSTRSMSTWLTFEPRRGLVLTAKLTASVLGATVLAAVMVAIVGVGVWFLGDSVGVASTATPADRSTILTTLLRLLIIGALGGLLGAATGFLLRHAAAALGVLMAYAVAGEILVRGLVPSWVPWLASINATALVQGRATYEVLTCDAARTGEQMCRSRTEVITLEHGAIYLLVVAVLAVALAALTFRRRDVT